MRVPNIVVHICPKHLYAARASSTLLNGSLYVSPFRSAIWIISSGSKVPVGFGNDRAQVLVGQVIIMHAVGLPHLANDTTTTLCAGITFDVQVKLSLWQLLQQGLLHRRHNVDQVCMA